MKILWFTNTACSANEKFNLAFNKGGWLTSLEKGLLKTNDIDLHIAFYHKQNINSFEYNNTRYHPIYFKKREKVWMRYLNRVFLKNYDNEEIDLLKKVVNEVQPDIIHVHGTEDNFGLIQFHTNIPVIISIQGIINPYAEKYYSGISMNIVSRYETIKNKLFFRTFRHHFNTFKMKAVREVKILQKSQYIIGRTDWDKRVTRLLAPGSRYFTGQEMLRSAFYEGYWNKTKFNKDIQIVTVTSGALHKGFETVIRTAKLLCLNKTLNFSWKVIGLSDNSPIVRLCSDWLQIDTNDVNVQLLGQKNENEIVEMLTKSDIYCQVSHIENSANSLCEAMHVGLPIIATFAGGTNTLLRDNVEGLLVQDGDSFAFAGAILEIIGDFNKAKNFANEAKNTAVHRHDRSKIIDELMKIYHTVLET